MSKVWFITGTSKGFGRVWAEAALERGDRVAATARDTSTLADLVERYGDNVLPIELDVTDKAAVDAAVARGARPLRRARRRRQQRRLRPVRHDRGAVTRSRPARRSRPTCSARCGSPRPRCRSCASRARGHIIQVSSIGGVNAFPMLGLYHASKWGLEAFSQSLAAEVAPFGIKVTIVEPAGYSTDWSGPSSVPGRARSTPTTHVRELRAQMTRERAGTAGRPGGHRPRDPASSSTPTSRRCARSSARACSRHDPPGVRAPARRTGRPGTAVAARRPRRSAGPVGQRVHPREWCPATQRSGRIAVCPPRPASSS